MSRTWASLGADERRMLGELFAAFALADEVVDAAHQAEPSAVVTLQRLYDAVDLPGPLGADVAAALLADPVLRADFEALLDRVACYRLPRAAVASTGRLDRREAAGCTISLIPSRADPTQTYVLIRAGEEGGPALRELLARVPSGEYLKESLPPPDGGTVRLLKADADALVAALRDPRTEVFVL